MRILYQRLPRHDQLSAPGGEPPRGRNHGATILERLEMGMHRRPSRSDSRSPVAWASGECPPEIPGLSAPALLGFFSSRLDRNRRKAANVASQAKANRLESSGARSLH